MKKDPPAYLSLYETIREEILSGIRPYGSRLPSRRVLARDRGVSAVTVDHSYELLCEEGYAESRPKSGYFVTYREEDGFSLPVRLPRAAAPSPVLPGSRDSFPFPTLARVMRRVLTDYGERILIRPPNTGCPELREALCRYLARNRGIRVQSDQLVIGAGAEYLYGLVVELLGPRRTYGIEAPSYKKIEQVYRARGVRLDFCSLGQDGIMTEALRSTPASVLHITPFRSFPSGVTASASKRREYLRWVYVTDGYLVEDDDASAFSRLRPRADPLFVTSKGRNVLYLNTFSRTVSPSLRVGYMVIPRDLLPAFELRLGFYSCTVPAFEQYVLTELLNSGDFERHINRIRRLDRTQRSSGGRTA